MSEKPLSEINLVLILSKLVGLDELVESLGITRLLRRVFLTLGIPKQLPTTIPAPKTPHKKGRATVLPNPVFLWDSFLLVLKERYVVPLSTVTLLNTVPFFSWLFSSI